MANQQIGSYFTETTKGDEPKHNQAGYIYGETDASAVLTSTDNTLVSYPIGMTASTDKPRNNFANKKILVGINVTIAYADVAATLVVQTSGDGSNWAATAAATASSDTTPNLTGVKWFTVDLTDIYAPYFRLAFNAGGVNCGTSGKLKFLYSIPAPDGA